MFNPTNIDEFCVQATHFEARGKHNIDEKIESEGKGKGKFYGRGKRNRCVKREKEKLTWKNYSKTSHDEDQCWQLHPELKQNRLKAKEKGKIVAIVEHDLGSDSGDETRLRPWVWKVHILQETVLQIVQMILMTKIQE